MYSRRSVCRKLFLENKKILMKSEIRYQESRVKKKLGVFPNTFYLLHQVFHEPIV